MKDQNLKIYGALAQNSVNTSSVKSRMKNPFQNLKLTMMMMPLLY